MVKGRTSAGRQKIEMRKIENQEALHVCFSKRRMGVFKKASDLSTLTGAEIAIIVFSPTGKAFSFGSPNVDVVIDRFLSGGRAPSSSGLQDGAQGNVIRELNARCMELMESLEAAKRRKITLEGRLKALVAENPLCAWASNADSLGLSELEQLVAAMADVKARADARIAEIFSAGAATGSNFLLAVDPMTMVNPFNPGATVAPYAGNKGYGPGFY